MKIFNLKVILGLLFVIVDINGLVISKVQLKQKKVHHQNSLLNPRLQKFNPGNAESSGIPERNLSVKVIPQGLTAILFIHF